MRALALAVTGLAATSTATRSDKKANLRNGRRKLSESIDLHKLEHDALVGGLGSKIFFKVSADSSSSKRRIKTLARGVAKDLDCESSEATRVFRPAGKHEADHAASGLNLWYQVDCSSKDVTLVEDQCPAACNCQQGRDEVDVMLHELVLVHLCAYVD